MNINKILTALIIFVSLMFVILTTTLVVLVVADEKKENVFERQIEIVELHSKMDATLTYLTTQARAYAQTGNIQFYNNYQKEVNETKTLDTIKASYLEMELPTEIIALIDEIMDASTELAYIEQQAFEAIHANNLSKASNILFGAAYIDQDTAIQQLFDRYNETLKQWSTNELHTSNQQSNSSIVIFGLSLLLSLVSLQGLAIYLRKKLRPLKTLTNFATTISEGNLQLEELPVKKNAKDEITQLSLAFNQMVVNLRSVITTVLNSSKELSHSSEELVANLEQSNQLTESVNQAIESVADGSASQIAQLAQNNAAMEEIRIGISHIAGTASNVASDASDATQKAQMGNTHIVDATSQMKAIEQAVVDTQISLQELVKNSTSIEQFVTAITDISDQTNLLALNASIEAARAGEQGKGFAVVADEVRKLAEQSSSSASQIRAIIQSVHQNIMTTEHRMASVTEQVSTGSQKIQATGESFGDILNATISVTNQIHEVSAVAEQISANTEQMKIMFDNLQDLSQNAAAQSQKTADLSSDQYASLEEISAATNQLANIATTLNSEVSTFKI